MGGFLHAGARFPPADRDRRGARLSGPCGAAARPLCDAEGQECRRREGRIAECARVGTCGAQVYLYAQRRLAMDAVAQGRHRSFSGARDVLQSERLRRTALGRAGQKRRGLDLQAACAGGAAREDDEVPELVPRTALAGTLLSGAVPCDEAPDWSSRSHWLRARRLLLAQTIRSALDRLVTAYADALAGHDGNTLHWRDGTVDAAFRTATRTRRSRNACGMRRSPISFASPIRAARSTSRRPSMPIRAVSATPASSRRCTATARRVKCRNTSFPSPGYRKLGASRSASPR